LVVFVTAESYTSSDDEEEEVPRLAVEGRDKDDVRARYISAALKSLSSKTPVEVRRALQEFLQEQDTPHYRAEDLSRDNLLDPFHQMKTHHAALILWHLMFEWDHKDVCDKSGHVRLFERYFERKRERRKCVVRCLVCHLAKTLAEGDVSAGRGLVPREAMHPKEVRDTMRQIKAKELRCASAEHGGKICCGTPHRPGAPKECLHSPTMPVWLEKIRAIWVNDDLRLYWDKSGRLSPERYRLKIMSQWDHILKSNKNKKVSEINDLFELMEEIKVCQLLCPYCHELKTYFNRDMVEWSWLPYAAFPYRDATLLMAPRASRGTNDTSRPGDAEEPAAQRKAPAK
jgi:hypothetical protein